MDHSRYGCHHFADDSVPGVDLIMPDAGFIIDKKRFIGIVFNTCT